MNRGIGQKSPCCQGVASFQWNPDTKHERRRDPGSIDPLPIIDTSYWSLNTTARYARDEG